jgi:hypothetical protein
MGRARTRRICRRGLNVDKYGLRIRNQLGTGEIPWREVASQPDDMRARATVPTRTTALLLWTPVSSRRSRGL